MSMIKKIKLTKME